MFLFVTLRGLMSTAVRLNIIGPLEAQTAQHSYGSFVEQLLKQGLSSGCRVSRGVGVVVCIVRLTTLRCR